MLCSFAVKAQERVVIIKQNPTETKVKFSATKAFSDSISVRSYLSKLRLELIGDGYLAASFDSLCWKVDTVNIQLELGKPYRWARLKNGNVREEMLSRVGFREKFYSEVPFKPRELSKLVEKLLDHAENNGYPFAEVYLDSIEVTNDAISASIQMQLHEFTTIDSLIIKGELLTNRRVIENHLGIVKNSPYNQAALNKIPNRLRELPYVQVIKPYEIGMRQGKADVYLYLNNRKASNFDGILGLLPNPVTNDVVVTGDVQLDLMNALRRGETINLRWQRLQTRTQQLDVRLVYPFILNTPLGTEFKLNLFRQDTLFSQVNLHAGIPYFFKGGDHVKIFVEDMQANVISPSAYQQGNLVDSRSTLFGIGIYTNKLDYRFNPRRGYAVEGTAAAGTKRIQENPLLDPTLLENTNLKSELYNVNFLARYFQPFGKKSTIMFRLRSGYFLNENMFLNEAYRIGGLKTLRGFDEQGIFATGYAIGTLEYRFVFEENSNFFVFYDQGVYENRIGDEIVTDSPFGFGGGVNFETGAGVFSLTYALGRQFDNQIEIRGGKIHFGFVSFF
jgi:outer membrane protein assembly factor BamA